MESKNPPWEMNPPPDDNKIYYAMRFGMSFIWLWPVISSWLLYPQEQSLNWLRNFGFTQNPYLPFVATCLLNLFFAAASAFFSSRKVWQFQLAAVSLYSIAIAIRLPELLIHPFGPIVKNIAVMCCLCHLVKMEKY